MCLSKPQIVLGYNNGTATVEFLGKQKKVKSPIELKKGEYVLCQLNIVARKIPKADAKVMLKEWRELNEWV